MTGSTQCVGRPIWAEISLGALQRNLLAIKRHISSNLRVEEKPRKVMSIVKANAYGHGACAIAPVLAKAGADWFGVACVSEGMELRNAGVRKPILVLGSYWPGEEELLVRFRLSPAITSCTQLALLERAVTKLGQVRSHLGIHLKINTGMNRLGIAVKDLDCFAGALRKCPHLRLQGTFTHFASSEVLDRHETACQMQRFKDALVSMKALGLSPGLVHTANSGAIAACPNSWADMVRPGAATYGYHPAYTPQERQRELESALVLEPALSLHTRIANIRSLEPGAGVGYGATFVAKRPSRIAVITAGYADGLIRGLSNRGCVIVRGQRARIVGNVSMDMATIDVTEIEEATVGDVVTIYGGAGSPQTAADVSHLLGTVVQDVLCAIGQRVRRVYVE